MYIYIYIYINIYIYISGLLHAFVVLCYLAKSKSSMAWVFSKDFLVTFSIKIIFTKCLIN